MTSSIFEAEAHSLILEHSNHAGVTERKLEEGARVLELATFSDLASQLCKASELHRLFSVRLASIARQLGEGGSR